MGVLPHSLEKTAVPSPDHTRQSTNAQGGTLRTINSLVEAGLTAPAHTDALTRVAERYAVAITPHIAGLIDRADPTDPIARQFVPSPNELVSTPDELVDPIGDQAHSPVKGIVHRYPDRVLLKPLHACPVYCRFCFRREQVGPGGEALTRVELDTALDYIRSRPAVWEVIVTGGDPFMLSPRRLAEILDALDEIAHVATVRIHTRVPMVDPARVDAALLKTLRRRKPLWIAIHANHAKEFTSAVDGALAQLASTGAGLLGQTVLLSGVNDDADTLEDLFRTMVSARIKPYYLHHPDLAPGTSHFRVSLDEGRAIMGQLRGRLSGIAQPTYVLDIPGGAGKVPVGPSMVAAGGVRDVRGTLHPYPVSPVD
jgi:lysine 2,3-aminomutase